MKNLLEKKIDVKLLSTIQGGGSGGSSTWATGGGNDQHTELYDDNCNTICSQTIYC